MHNRKMPVAAATDIDFEVQGAAGEQRVFLFMPSLQLFIVLMEVGRC